MTDSPIAFSDPRLGQAPPPPPVRPTPAVVTPEPVVNENTILDGLLADINEATSLPPVSYPLPHTSGYRVVADVNIPYEMVKAWQDQCVDQRGRLDQLQLAKTVIGAKVTTILRHEQPVTYEGRTLTFGSSVLWNKLGVLNGPAAVKKMIGPDGDIAAIGEAILSDAGYGTSVEGREWRPDPTQG